MSDNTVFDSAFRTIVQKMPELVIPLINEAFGRDYPEDEPFEQLRNEHLEPSGKIVTDSIFRIRGFVYHIECQSTDDATMAVRMIEYDFAIALEEATRSGRPYVVRFPRSCVLYLRHGPSTPDRLEVKVIMPSGQEVTYEAPVVKAQRYTAEEIFAKRLLLLMPFYIMRHEKELDGIASDERRTAELVGECARLRERLESETLGRGRSVLYDQIVEIAVRVSDYLTSTQAALGKKVRTAMGGEVWELMTDKLQAAEERAEREYERGVRDTETGEVWELMTDKLQAAEERAEREYERGVRDTEERAERETLLRLVDKGLITTADAAAELGIPESELTNRP